MPRLKHKPHALRPLSIVPDYSEFSEDGQIRGYTHPYQFELDNFKPTPSQLARGEIIQPCNLNNIPLVYVDTKAKLEEVLNELSGATEIAVDVEHHSYRSYQGITCLLQISSRENDYIIDTLALREDLHILNEVFANPQVVKVLHDGRWDILWMQRDLSIYVVNMFDTHKAAKQLSFDKLSLAFLLKHYCQINADKSSATDDWRKRPLPDKMLKYARQDTHYLLYIYDQLRQRLLDQDNGQTGLLLNVIRLSTEVCKLRYNKPKVLPDAHVKLCERSGLIFNNQQLFALKELYAWRDNIARQVDDSCGFVLPNSMMLKIAEKLPGDKQGILDCCNSVPSFVRQNIDEIQQFILKARELPTVKVGFIVTILDMNVFDFSSYQWSMIFGLHIMLYFKSIILNALVTISADTCNSFQGAWFKKLCFFSLLLQLENHVIIHITELITPFFLFFRFSSL